MADIDSEATQSPTSAPGVPTTPPTPTPPPSVPADPTPPMPPASNPIPPSSQNPPPSVVPPSTPDNPAPLWRRPLDIILRPRQFFASLDSESQFGPTIGYFLVWWTLTALLLAWTIDRSYLGYVFGSIGNIFLIYWLIGLVAFPIQVFIFHFVLAKFFGGQGMLLRTFQALVYGATPALLIGLLPLTLLPFLAVPISLYAWYLIGIGLITLHRVTIGQVVGAILANVVVTSILTWLAGLAFSGLITRALYGGFGSGFANPYASFGLNTTPDSRTSTASPTPETSTPRLVQAIPGDGDIQTYAPYTIQLSFTQPPIETGTTMSVVDETGREYTTGSIKVNPSPTWQAVIRSFDPSAPDGRYTVDYTVCFDNDPCLSDSYQFTLNRP